MKRLPLIPLGLLVLTSVIVWELWQGHQGPDATSASAASDPVQQALRSGKPTVVEFGSTSCTTCREMKPILGELAREHGARINVIDIDLLRTTGYISRYKIQLMPTQVFFDAQGRETGRHMGKISARDMLSQLGPSASPETAGAR
jgi:thioredoxin 1